jgi:hypothetical protein
MSVLNWLALGIGLPLFIGLSVKSIILSKKQLNDRSTFADKSQLLNYGFSSYIAGGVSF